MQPLNPQNNSNDSKTPHQGSSKSPSIHKTFKELCSVGDVDQFITLSIPTNNLGQKSLILAGSGGKVLGPHFLLRIASLIRRPARRR